MVITDTFIRWLPRAPVWSGAGQVLFSHNAWSFSGTPVPKLTRARRCVGYLRADGKVRWRQ